MHQALLKICKRIPGHQISWAVGGSLMLQMEGLVDVARDIDILVDEKCVKTMIQFLKDIGTEHTALSKDPYRTKVFKKYQIGEVEVDLMSGFALRHDEGIYEASFPKQAIRILELQDGQVAPFCYLEDWYVLYMLMPNKGEKVMLIEHHFENVGINHPERLEIALRQPLPTHIVKRVMRWL
ncbi:hypothetical protein AB990_07950 [Alkalihalobacillus pseudalcaliphilus]|nr:hypothetical protein AB990_07950 [Alkalihalobacillus pseudalcaliphilus]